MHVCTSTYHITLLDPPNCMWLFYIVRLIMFPLLLLLLSRFSHVWLCDPIDGSPSGSSISGILQARTLEWVAISFSNAWKWKVKVKSLSHVWLLATAWTAAHQAPLSMGFSRQEYWSGVPLPSPFYALGFLKGGKPFSPIKINGGSWLGNDCDKDNNGINWLI